MILIKELDLTNEVLTINEIEFSQILIGKVNGHRVLSFPRKKVLLHMLRILNIKECSPYLNFGHPKGDTCLNFGHPKGDTCLEREYII